MLALRNPSPEPMHQKLYVEDLFNVPIAVNKTLKTLRSCETISQLETVERMWENLIEASCAYGTKEGIFISFDKHILQEINYRKEQLNLSLC